MSNLIRAMALNKLASLKTGKDALLRGIEANEADLREQNIRLESIDKDIQELETYLGETINE